METSSYEKVFFTKVKDWKQKRCNIYYTFRKKKYSLRKKTEWECVKRPFLTSPHSFSMYCLIHHGDGLRSAGPAHHINFGALEEEHCRLAFLRGAFLAGGSVTDPQKGYHLELATTHLRVSRELNTLLLELGYAPKETTRKANYITYFKQSEAIEDLLTAIGAPIAAMTLMNTKAEKFLRNGVNRRVNCEAANVDKTVDAALEQRRAIQILRKSGALDELTPKLQEAAQLREAHPELSLSQLAALCDPPVTKSSLSHRLRKLIQLSQKSE